jgi:hypothetical protein
MLLVLRLLVLMEEIQSWMQHAPLVEPTQVQSIQE